MNQRELLAIVEDSWSQLDAAVTGLDEATMNEAGVVETWSIKDLLGHVAAWEQVAIRRAQAGRDGKPFSDVVGASIDAFNAAEALRRRQMFLSEVQQEAAEMRQQLRATIEALSEEEWNTVITDGDRTRSLGDWVGGDLSGGGPGNHAAEHADQIRAWRAARHL